MSDYWIEILLREAQSRHLKTRLEAEQWLQKLSAEERETAYDIVDRWAIKHERSAAIFAALHPVMILGQLCCPIAFFFVRLPVGGVIAAISWLFCFVGGSVCGELKYPSISAIRAKYLWPLRAGEPHLNVARLIDMLGGHMYSPRAAASATLSKALAELGPESLSSISESHRHRLYWFLQIDNFYNQSALLNAILDFVERTGDIVAYDRVRSLAACPAVTPGAKRIRDRARACAASLAPLVKQAELRDSLLRPIESPSESTLLRPAGAVPIDDQLLLRSVDSHDAEHAR